MTIATFYAVTQWRNRYGIKGPYYRGSHHGHDIACAGRQRVPCYRGGTVQAWKHSKVVGQTLAIRHGLGDYTGYCHLINRIPRPGTVIAAGAFVGQAATWGDFTGSAWSGPHVHTVVGNSAACVFGIGTRDPAPYIRAALTASSTAVLEIEDIDMATAQEIAQVIWTHMLTQTAGARGTGRAADWLVNLPDQVGQNVWNEPLTHKSGITGTASQWLLNTSDMVGAVLAKPSTVIDPVKLAAELSKAGIAVTIDTAAIAKAVDASLRDDFAAIPGAVVGGIKAAL